MILVLSTENHGTQTGFRLRMSNLKCKQSQKADFATQSCVTLALNLDRAIESLYLFL